MDGNPVTIKSIVINDEEIVTAAKIEVNGYTCNYSDKSNTISHFYVNDNDIELFDQIFKNPELIEKSK